MRDTSILQIDLRAIDHNMRVLRTIAGDAAICPIVKADAYGLGAGRLAKHLAAHGAAMFATYSTDQAAVVARGVTDRPILILMPVWSIERTDELYRALIGGRLHLTVHGLDHLQSIIRIAEQFGAVIPVHVEVDTGMSRGGISPVDAPAIFERIARNRWVRLSGMFTHFSAAESAVGPTDAQLAAFHAVLEQNESLIPHECTIHAANSAAALRHPRFHCHMIRIGLAWMGYGSELIEGDERVAGADDLRAALTWLSRIVHIKTIDAGTPVGYDSRWTARRRSRIALVPAGYADGYPIACTGDDDREPAMIAVRVESTSGWKRIFVPVVGAVNMDQITIDVTDLPASCAVGAEVELISPDPEAPNHLPKIAERVGTIPHELLCRLNPRLRRVHLLNANLVETKPAPARIAVG